MASKKNNLKFSLSRYVWTGGAIGLYFGFFFRPQREANFGYTLVLAVMVAVVLTGLPVKTRQEIVTAVRAMQTMGVAHVVVSLGKAGALLVNNEQTVLAASPAIEERNPIGAGIRW